MKQYKVSKKPSIIREECAFIIIDMQNDFCISGGKFVQPKSYYEERIQAIVAPIKELLQFASEANIPVIYSKTWYYPDYVDAPRISVPREIGALKRGTRGAEIIDDLKPQDGRGYVIEATRYDKFTGTNLEMLLRGLSVRTLILMGATTNVCVESTTRAARDRDFFPIVLSDCTAAFEESSHQASLNNIDGVFGSVLTSKELIGCLS